MCFESSVDNTKYGPCRGDSGGELLRMNFTLPYYSEVISRKYEPPLFYNIFTYILGPLIRGKDIIVGVTSNANSLHCEEGYGDFYSRYVNVRDQEISKMIRKNVPDVHIMGIESILH